MNNTLKDIFTKEKPKYFGTLSFNSEADLNEFMSAISEATENEKMISVPSIKGINHFVQISGKKQLLRKPKGEVTSVFVGPYVEPCPFTVQTDYGPYTFNFKRIKKQEGVVLQNSENAVVHIRMIVKPEDGGGVTYTFKTNPTLAKTITSIGCEYNALRHLIAHLHPPEPTKKVKKVLDALRSLEEYWGRVGELEKVLGVPFEPSNITDSMTDEANMEKLYVLLIKKYALRESLNDITVTYKDSNEPFRHSVGTHIGLTTRDEMTFFIYGVEIKVYASSIYFNAIVDAIEDDIEPASYKVRFCGTETKPLFKVIRGYLREEDVPEKEDFNKLYKEFSDAKTFNQIIDELQSEYHVGVRVME